VARSGFFTNAGIVGMYAILAQVFPTHARASGTGFAVGIGRGGSVLSPIMAGYLLDGGLNLFMVSMVMGSGSVIAAVLLLWLKLGSPDSTEGSKTADDEVAAGVSKPAPA